MTPDTIKALALDVAQKREAWEKANYAVNAVNTAQTMTLEQRVARELREAEAAASVSTLWNAFDEARQALRKAVQS